MPHHFERFPFAENRKTRWRRVRDWAEFAKRELHELGPELRPSQILALLAALRSRSLWFRAFTIASWFYRARRARRAKARARGRR